MLQLHEPESGVIFLYHFFLWVLLMSSSPVDFFLRCLGEALVLLACSLVGYLMVVGLPVVFLPPLGVIASVLVGWVCLLPLYIDLQFNWFTMFSISISKSLLSDSSRCFLIIVTSSTEELLKSSMESSLSKLCT